MKMKKRIFALATFLFAMSAAAAVHGADISAISALKLENGVAKAEYTVSSDSEEEVIMALTSYDSENKIESVVSDVVSVKSNQTLTLEMNYGDAERVKSMIWGKDLKPLTRVRTILTKENSDEGFVDMSQVTLDEGFLKESQDVGLEYVLSMEPDRLLAPSFEMASVSTPNNAARYGGWERKGASNWTASADTFTLAGHSLGHWMSAAAVFANSTGNEEVKEMLDYTVDQLDYLQKTTKSGYIGGVDEKCFIALFSGNTSNWANNYWVPWYGIHKIYQGLIDAYEYTGNKTALNVALRFADWAVEGTKKLTDAQMQTMLNVEYGGMNEVFAQLYEITGDTDYLSAARRFTHDSVVTPLINEKDQLSGLHANTQMPKIIGIAKMYDVAPEKFGDYRKAAKYYWDSIVYNRSYVIGGTSINEHFENLGLESLGVKTAETCNVYNMLKLTEHMFAWEHDSKYMDYYEKTMYNQILASQDPDTGNKMYFVSLLQGHYKIYGTAHDSFWCCTGTGMENPARYTKCAYYKDGNELYVNLYMPSTINWAEKNMTFTQETNYPYSDKVKLTLTEGRGEATIKFRVPSWAKSGAIATYNAKEYRAESGGYLEITADFAEGDVIELTIPMSLEKYVSRANQNKVAFTYGPVVLAAPLGNQNFPNDTVQSEIGPDATTTDVAYIVYDGNDVNELISSVDTSKLEFKLNGQYTSTGEDVKLVPFYEIHHEFQNVYWNYNEEGDIFTKKLNNATVDSVTPDGQQDELGHALQGVNTHNGSFSANGTTYMWRDAWGSSDAYFEYTMALEEGSENILCVAYWGSDGSFAKSGVQYTRNFLVYANNVKIATQTINNNKPNSPYYCYYELPDSVIDGQKFVTIKFQANGANKCAGGVLEMRILREKVE